MGKQGCAPKVAEMVKTIEGDDFSACFFLSTLYKRKEEELRRERPEAFTMNTHEAARIRAELILVNMYLHIKKVQAEGLQSMRAKR